MYCPKVFKESDPKSMFDFIQAHPLATLISNSKSGLNAEHIPFLITETSDSKFILKAHIAKANPLWKELEQNASVLVAFQGSDSYISPNWYPSKKLDSKVVPTWNYTAVHAKGNIQFIQDNQWLLSLLNELTNTHEQNQALAWSVNDAPTDFIEKQLKAIVGIEIEVDNLIAKFKLSQNQTTENRQGVKSALEKLKHPMSDLMAD